MGINEDQISGIILSLDAGKGFDSVLCQTQVFHKEPLWLKGIWESKHFLLQTLSRTHDNPNTKYQVTEIGRTLI